MRSTVSTLRAARTRSSSGPRSLAARRVRRRSRRRLARPCRNCSSNTAPGNTPPAPTAAQQAAAGIAYGPTNANPAFAPLWVYDPTGFGTATVMNFANVFRTKGAAGNSTPANANFVGGKQIVNSNVSFAGQPMLYG